MDIYETYARARQKLQPYWIAAPKKKKTVTDEAPTENSDPKPEEPIENHQPEPEEPTVPTRHHDPAPVGLPHHHRVPIETVESIQRGETLPREQWETARGLTVTEMDRPLTAVWKRDRLPLPQHVWYYHDENTHELFSHLIPGSAQKATTRNNAVRKNMALLIAPRNGSYDKTHLIPFGFHGSEASARLLIGWDSAQNRGPMNVFESEQKKRTEPFYWMVRVTKKERGAQLIYAVYDAVSLDLLAKKKFVMEDTEFKWLS